MTGPIRVMVVDDHPMWRDAVARDLAGAGMEVVATAGDGDEALRRMPAARPDVVVLDLKLPRLSGAEVARRLVGEHPGVRVLVLTASAEQADVLEAVKAGATGYLVKSASREELLDAVARTAQGEAVFTPGLAGMLLGEFRRMAVDAAPTPSAAPGGTPPAAPAASGGPGAPAVPGAPGAFGGPGGPGGPGEAEERGGPTWSAEARAVEPPQLTDRETEILRLVAKGLSSRQIAGRLEISYRTVQNHTQNVLGKLQLHNRVELARYAIEQGLDTSSSLGRPGGVGA